MDGVAPAILESESDISETTEEFGSFGKLDILTEIVDPREYPWQYNDGNVEHFDIKNGLVRELTCTGVLEYTPGKDRGRFMDECYRILSDDGKMTIIVPYWNTWRAYYDSRLEWPPFCEQSFLVYNKEWREMNMKGVELRCDFDFTYGYAWSAETQARNDESRSFWTAHYTNCVDVLQLVLTKRKT